MAVVQEKAGNGNTDSTEHKSHVHPNQVTNIDEVLGHVPRLMAYAVTKFLKRGANSGIRSDWKQRGRIWSRDILCL